MKRAQAFQGIAARGSERDVLGNDLVDPSPLANRRYVFVSDARHGSRVYVGLKIDGGTPPSEHPNKIYWHYLAATRGRVAAGCCQWILA